MKNKKYTIDELIDVAKGRQDELNNIAENGEGEDQYTLWELYKNGEHEITQDDSKSIYWLTKVK